ncbi:MAG: hypothetical protein K6T83_20260, partial [Alicyclobacillus sp.]|nr:hypothetical protein [Alicyclobacillus sp.]
MAADDASRLLHERRKALQKKRREQNLKRMLSLTAWALSVGSIGGFLSMVHLLAPARTQHEATRLQQGATRLYPASDAPRETVEVTRGPAEVPGRAKTQVSPALLPGSSGPQVTRLQQALSKLGFFSLSYFT